jgi:hypothetical protein
MFQSLYDNTNTTKTTSKEVLKKQRLHDKNSAQAPSPPESYILGTHHEESLCSQNNRFNKTIVRYTQLRLDIRFHLER